MGFLFLGLSLFGWSALVTGTLLTARDPHAVISFLGTPIGGLFLAYGTGRIPSSSASRTAFRLAVFSLGFALIAVGSRVGVAAGSEMLLTALGFSVMAASFLGLATLVFLVRGLRRGVGS